MRSGTSRRRSPANDRPVAVGIPGYIVPMDSGCEAVPAAGQAKGRNVAVAPVGALAVTARGAHKNGQLQYVLRGKKWGRSRLTVNYSDGTAQTIHYYVTKPSVDVVADMGRFLDDEGLVHG
jgi:hypothetical protein